jgi:hypothetical protein
LVIAFAWVNIASADDINVPPKPIKVVSLTFAKAMSMPGLVQAMNEQLSLQDFLDGHQLVWVGEVTYQGSLYRITGTRVQWIRFFLLQMDWPVNNKNQFEIGPN